MNNREVEVNTIENKVVPTTKIFDDAKDVNVAATIIYTTDGSTFTYDKEGNVAVPAEDMFDLFVKGVLAVKSDVYYKPTSCTVAGVITFAFTS